MTNRDSILLPYKRKSFNKLKAKAFHVRQYLRLPLSLFSVAAESKEIKRIALRFLPLVWHTEWQWLMTWSLPMDDEACLIDTRGVGGVNGRYAVFGDGGELAAQGVTLRSFADSSQKTGAKWTIDIPGAYTGTKHNPEIKFIVQ